MKIFVELAHLRHVTVGGNPQHGLEPLRVVAQEPLDTLHCLLSGGLGHDPIGHLGLKNFST